VPPPQQSGYDPSCLRFEKRPSRNFTTLAESQNKLFEIQPICVIETVVAQGMTRSGRCYTLYELDIGGQKKYHANRTISKGKQKSSVEGCNRRTIPSSNIKRRLQLRSPCGPC